MKSLKFLAPTLLAVLAITSPALAGYTTPGLYFVEPIGWDVGDAGSTSQSWDNLYRPPVPIPTTNITPDISLVTNPAIATPSTINVSSPGFATSSGNFYSFASNYEVFSNIFNHGTGGSDGTHVIVQTAGTSGGATGTEGSVIDNTLEIVDLSGNSLSGGANSEALVHGDAIFQGVFYAEAVASDVDYEVLIWEFFLPGYTGDFRVQWTTPIHSSFDQLRVDSMIASTAFSPSFVPEPTSLALAGICALGLAMSRKRR